MANGWNDSTWGALAWSGILNSNVEVISPGNDPWGSFGASQYFQDSSGNNVSITNNNSVVGIQSNPFNISSSGSLQFINAAYPNGEYLSATVPAPSTDSITYECWFYRTSATPVAQGILQTRTNTADGDGIDVSVANNKITVTSAGTFLLSDAGPTQSLNTWYHIAVVRNGTTNFTVYLNGTSIGTFNRTGLTSTQLKLGLKSLTGGNEYFNGYISNFRYVKGTAVYTSNFTVPTAPLTAITNTQLLLNTASPSTAWGQGTFGGVNNLNINLESVSVAIGIDVIVTGQQLTIDLNSVTPLANANVDLTGQELTTTLGDIDPGPDVALVGQELTATLNSVTAFTDVKVDVTGQELTSTLSNVSISIASNPIELVGFELTANLNSIEILLNTPVDVTGQLLSATLNSVTAFTDVNIDITGQQLTSTLGNVDPSPDAIVVGIGMTASLAVGTVVIATADVNVTGQQLILALGSVNLTANANVNVTGNTLTMSLNSINNQIWTVVNTGTPANWTEIDTAA